MIRCRGVIAFDHIQGHTTVSRTPLDEGSARRRELYLTTLTIETSMPPAGFEPPIPAIERLQTLALDRSANGNNNDDDDNNNNNNNNNNNKDVENSGDRNVVN
jgi:hypothetical protein